MKYVQSGRLAGRLGATAKRLKNDFKFGRGNRSSSSRARLSGGGIRSACTRFTGKSSNFPTLLKRALILHQAHRSARVNGDALRAAIYLRSRVELDGKSDFVTNNDIAELVRGHQDPELLQAANREARDHVRSGSFTTDNWRELIDLFRGYFGLIPYPDLPEGTPDITPIRGGDISAQPRVSSARSLLSERSTCRPTEAD